MYALLLSTGLVALAEVGDRTQILAVMLVSRFRRPLPVLLGVLLASTVAQLLASVVGAAAGSWIQGPWMQRLVGISLIGFAIWTLLPEGAVKDEAAPKIHTRRSVLLTTFTAFLLMEMGDRTQFAALALAARFRAVAPVAIGSTLGMMVANTPAVLAGHAIGDRLPLRLIHLVAAALSAGLGVWTLATA
jgi:Ca2+/H+ antiporter, TMEM165/GDT1 family